MRSLTRPLIRRTLGATACAGLAMALLAGCGSGSTAAAASNTAPSDNSSAGANTGAGTGQGRAPGVSGQIAAVSGKTLQVQGSDSQTAVTYTASTVVTQVVSAAQSDLAVGKCISVTPVASTNTAGTGTTSDLTTPVTASSVSISDPVDGTCLRAGGFGGPARPAGASGATGAPAGVTGATGFAGGMRGFGGGVSGTVASISGDTVTVTASTPGATGSSGVATTPRTVTLDSGTTYTKTEQAADSALTVGQCVSAQGATDASTGTLSASSIAIRPATNGECSTGFRGGAAADPNTAADPVAAASTN